MKYKSVSTIAAILCGGFLVFIPAFAQEGASSSTPKGKILEKMEYDDFKFVIDESSAVYDYRTDPALAKRVNEMFKIENEEQFSRRVFNGYAERYETYPKKARIPDSDRILISIPDHMERIYAPFAPTKENAIGRHNSFIDYYSYQCFLENDKKNVACQVGMTSDKNAKCALARAVIHSADRGESSTAGSTWPMRKGERGIARVRETPFDFTANGPGMFNIQASYYNVMLDISPLSQKTAQNTNRIQNDYYSQAAFQPIMDRIVGLFHGHETAEDIKKVDWLDLAPEAVKSDEGETGTTFEAVCKFKDQYKDMRDKHWILVVADKGELSVEKAEFKALERKFRNKTYSSESVQKFFRDAREVPDTVFLKLPEGEKTATVTFYFISEDGTQYSSQSVTMTVPETPAPNKVD